MFICNTEIISCLQYDMFLYRIAMRFMSFLFFFLQILEDFKREDKIFLTGQVEHQEKIQRHHLQADLHNISLSQRK